ncbi:nitroreductase family deazaflavin-dependent oxidoreductase [Actinomadura sp. ATCC 31491]|uniref:Nitroreductase family deazaflavin-dependent oxidoreductase n=1 Tax=Actinomadura luzonensis TaxID=2805427 RepID=A0ABT0FLQ9_9ACTN|nr:nitroreductase family deazaflavin-dependent oxidoreductase [Actinomadura luzonensis]MCK2213274.1 nitroreductase family deazaflavin-dependent oxidoreductase [Actinomadura luzonensis]
MSGGRRAGDRVIAAVRPFFQWLAGTRGFALAGSRVVPALDRALSRLSGGRLLMGDRLIPHLLLTTTGSRTGRPRETPLACLPAGDGTFLVVGSNFGKERHPAWSGNLLKTPQATVTFRGRVVPVTATLLTGAERERVWPDLIRFWPLYQGYTERSGRELRVFRLTPRSP